jgi:hypothetical protein
MTIAERFWAKVQQAESCWWWTASVDAKSGYGWFSIRRKMFKAHRIAWQLARGPIPAGLHVLHHCDNRKCVNPAHLFLGTNADNIADRMNKGRKSGCAGERNGRAKLTRDEVALIRSQLASGKSQDCLAGRFGVSQSCISQIALGHNWNAVQSS